MRQRSLVIHSLWLVIYILLGLSCYPAYGAETVSSGQNLPQFTLDVPDSVELQEYLGLKNLKSFSISQIPAKLILLEVFSIYCHVCHKQAPLVNKLYKFIQEDSDLRNDIKIIGIGAGGKPRDLVPYEKKFRVPFPVFPDPYLDIHKKLGSPGVPFIIVVTNAGKVLFTHVGLIEDAEEFFGQIKKFHKQQ